MDFRLVWSPEAIEDVEKIAEYIERDSKFYAKSVVEKIFDTVQKIKCFPMIGRIVPEIGGQNIRELFIYSYRLVYQVKNNQILIVAVIHGKQIFENLSDRFTV